jgi:hypothetical protein
MNLTEVFSGEIQNNELQILYDKNIHIAEFNIDETPESDTNAFLEKYGIFTRVDSVLNSNNKLRVKLKPATSVELRDETGTLKKRPVSNPTDGSVITKQRNSNRFSATVPVDVLDEFGIQDSEKVSLYIDVNSNGNICFTLQKDDSPHALTARRGSGGEVHIPSAIGTACDLDGHAVYWECHNDKIVGETSVSLEHVEITERDTSNQYIVSISRKSQDIEKDGESWSQEHFQTYIRNDAAVELNWNNNDYIDIKMAQSDNNLVLIFSSNIRRGYTEKTPCVKKLNTYNNGNQLNIYIPNAIAHATGMTESMRCTVVDEQLIGWN